MKPIVFPGANCIYSKDKKGVEPLPACKFDTGEVLSCWELSPDEIEKVRQTGCIWLTVQTFNMPLQPMFMTVNKNDIIIENNDESVS